MNIFSSKILAEHPMVIFHMTVGAQQPKGNSSRPTRGSAEPPGQPNPGSHCAGPTCSNGHLTVVAGLSSRAFTRFPLNRGRKRGEELSCSLSSLSLPLTFFARVFLGFWLKFDCKKSLSHFFAVRLSTHMEEQQSGRIFIFISLT